MRQVNELDCERPRFDYVARWEVGQPGVAELVLVELRPDHPDCQGAGINRGRYLGLPEQVRKRTDVVLVPMGQDDCLYPVRTIDEI